jgi:ubiquinone biosynthesis monooxygenase Coq7
MPIIRLVRIAEASRMQQLSPIDEALACADNALRTLSGTYSPARKTPGSATPADQALPATERRLSAALMRVNHVGEVCAQALYAAQRLTTEDAGLKRHFDAAARDEFDHLAWTRQRLQQLGDRTSLLNPLWYAGAFGIGLLAGRLGTGISLGFLAETEHQVEQHLQSHLERLPADDHASRAIVEQMLADEARHAADAREAGGVELPQPVKLAMRLTAKLMTQTAHHL